MTPRSIHRVAFAMPRDKQHDEKYSSDLSSETDDHWFELTISSSSSSVTIVSADVVCG